MSNTAIKIENLSKQYRLGEISTGAITHDINRWWHNIRGKENPYLKIGEANDRASKGTSEYVWSLKDINFEIKQGEAVGIIGRNGAGKSTLLKILSKVTQPTTGIIRTKGRIASLLEVGTGFHPELSGRDNIFLNGAILGMRKAETARKFDEIVDFSGVERYIDTPVKRYSSGMYVRLAFAVAAYLESEILIVDEVLAVGDAEFQKKCLGKMNDVSKGEGRTVIFVSHNMAAVKALCNKGILLDYGNVIEKGLILDVINKYVNNDLKVSEFIFNATKKSFISKIVLKKEDGINSSTYNFTDNIYVEVNTVLFSPKVTLAINLKDTDFNVLFIDEVEINHSGTFIAKIPSSFLLKGTYIIDVYLYTPNVEFFSSVKDIIKIEILDLPPNFVSYENAECGVIKSPISWENI